MWAHILKFSPISRNTASSFALFFFGKNISMVQSTLLRHRYTFAIPMVICLCLLQTRGVSWSLPVFSIKKTLNSQGNLKKILFKVLTIGFYTFCLSFRQIVDTIQKKLFLFQGKPFNEPFFEFFKIGEALLCEWVFHRCEKVIVKRGEVWRVRRVR